MHPKKLHKNPAAPIRMLLQIASLVLCLLLIVSLDATVFIEDLQALTSTNGIHTILDYLTSYDTSDTASSDTSMEDALLVPLTPSNGVTFVSLSNTSGTLPQDIDIPDNVEIPDDAEIPDMLTEYVHGIINDMLGEDQHVTAEQIHTFMEESTVVDYISEKAPSVLHDLMTGNSTAEFTTEEIMQLIEENEQLIEEVFQLEITEDLKQDIEARLQQSEADGTMDETLRTVIEQLMHTQVPGTEGMEVGDLLQKLEWFTHIEALFEGIVICFVLTGLIMLVNYYNPPRGLSWAASAHIVAGIILSVPLFVIHLHPVFLSNLLPQSNDLMRVMDGAYSVMAPYHYAILVVGILMSVASIVWRFFYKKQMAQA